MSPGCKDTVSDLRNVMTMATTNPSSLTAGDSAVVAQICAAGALEEFSRLPSLLPGGSTTTTCYSEIPPPPSRSAPYRVGYRAGVHATAAFDGHWGGI